MLDLIREQAEEAAEELCIKAGLVSGQIVVVGCSSSEIAGKNLGSFSNPEIGKAVFDGIYGVLKPKGIYLAAQCCEHLNRAIITERAAACGFDIVNVVPQIKAGGAFATAAYNGFESPVALESIKADAGLDIGGTLIGMHMKSVAVPMRLEIKKIGEAPVNSARTRPKFIGGVRAVYDENLL